MRMVTNMSGKFANNQFLRERQEIGCLACEVTKCVPQRLSSRTVKFATSQVQPFTYCILAALPAPILAVSCTAQEKAAHFLECLNAHLEGTSM